MQYSSTGPALHCTAKLHRHCTAPEAQQVVDAARGPLPRVERGDGEVGDQLNPLLVALQPHLCRSSMVRYNVARRRSGMQGGSGIIWRRNSQSRKGWHMHRVRIEAARQQQKTR